MTEATVKLRKHEGRLLKSGGAWIFDNEIAEVSGTFANGDLVRVEDFDGYPLGTGFINMHSRIRVRMLTRDPEAVIDRAFFRERLARAWAYRKKTVDTSSCRLVFGEADDLPGITIDKYEDVLVVESLALGIDRWKDMIAELAKEVLAEDGITVRGIYERSDSKERLKEGMERKKGFIGEPFDTTVRITENGVRYLVDVKDGQKTGFFLDQKYNRLAIQRLAKGGDVLDCFTHTGSFALNAALGGAAFVTGVDASEEAVGMARKNAGLNGFTNVEFMTADVLDLLPKLRAEGKTYDLVRHETRPSRRLSRDLLLLALYDTGAFREHAPRGCQRGACSHPSGRGPGSVSGSPGALDGGGVVLSEVLYSAGSRGDVSG